MHQNAMTIAQLADHFQVTRRTIRYHLQQIGGGQNKDDNGHILISPTEQAELKHRIIGKDRSGEPSDESVTTSAQFQRMREAITYLNQQVHHLQMENRVLQQQQEGLTNLVAEKEQQLTQIQDQIQFLQTQLQTQTQILDQEQQLHLHTKQELDQIKETKRLLESDLAKKQNNWLTRWFS